MEATEASSLRVAVSSASRLGVTPADIVPPIPFDPAPLQLSEQLPVPKIHFLFAICLFSQMFVTRDGRLLGVVLKEDLTDPTHSK